MPDFRKTFTTCLCRERAATVLQFFERSIGVVKRTDIVVSPCFRPEVRLLSESASFLEESFCPLLVLLLRVLVAVKDDRAQVADVVVVAVSSSGELPGTDSSAAMQVCDRLHRLVRIQ